MIKILCFGDSITLGEKDFEEGGWADRLKKHFFEKYVDSATQKITLYNLGVASETTDGLYKRFENEYMARNIKGQKLIVIFSYGANDIVIHKEKNIVPEPYYVRNLKHCIEFAKQYNAEILLLSLLPMSDSIEAKFNQHGKLRFNKDILTYNLILKKLAHDMSCEYLDLYAPFVANNKEELLSDDGVHPNSKGHKLLYKKIIQKLSSISK